MGLAHWDDVEPYRRAKGEMDALWQRLGDAAGTKGVGVNRVRVAPGKLSTPPHAHGASEEVFYVLEGSGLAWQDGQVHDVRPRDCVIHRAAELAHTFVAGPDGLDYLAFGTRHPTDAAWLPRSAAVRLGRQWTEGRSDDPWDSEAEVPPLSYGEPAERPPNIVNVDEVELEHYRAANDGDGQRWSVPSPSMMTNTSSSSEWQCGTEPRPPGASRSQPKPAWSDSSRVAKGALVAAR